VSLSGRIRAAARHARRKRLQALRVSLARLLAARGVAGAVWAEDQGDTARIIILAQDMPPETRASLKDLASSPPG
jgi:hypothetical protein